MPFSANQRPRRAVVDKMRRRIERALATADEAEELAKAAQAVLDAAEEHVGLGRVDLKPLRDSVARYRAARDG